MIPQKTFQLLWSFDLVYLATPYKLFPGGPEAAFVEAAKIHARLIGAGLAVYCPIAHTHPAATYGEMDAHDYAIWNKLNDVFIDRCDALVIATMVSWDISAGIAHEREQFERQKKPSYFLDPATMEISTSCPIAAQP